MLCTCTRPPWNPPVSAKSWLSQPWSCSLSCRAGARGRKEQSPSASFGPRWPPSTSFPGSPSRRLYRGSFHQFSRQSGTSPSMSCIRPSAACRLDVDLLLCFQTATTSTNGPTIPIASSLSLFRRPCGLGSVDRATPGRYFSEAELGLDFTHRISSSLIRDSVRAIFGLHQLLDPVTPDPLRLRSWRTIFYPKHRLVPIASASFSVVPLCFIPGTVDRDCIGLFYIILPCLSWPTSLSVTVVGMSVLANESTADSAPGPCCLFSMLTPSPSPSSICSQCQGSRR